MRAGGASLSEIGLAFGLTRERVRQIIRDAGGPGGSQAEAARRAREEEERRQLRERALAEIRRAPGSTVDDVASALGTTADAVRSALGPEARRLLVTPHRSTSVFSDELILEHLRLGARYAGEPLTVRSYDQVRGSFDGASAPLVLQRFGSWRDACAAAGVAHGQPVRAHYSRRWTKDQLVDAVAQYLSLPSSRGSFADYERWARRTPGMPSSQTIRTQLGTWTRAKTQALQRLAKRSL